MRKRDYLLIKKNIKRRIKGFKKKINKAKSLRVTNGWIRFLPTALRLEEQQIKYFNKEYRD